MILLKEVQVSRLNFSLLDFYHECIGPNSKKAIRSFMVILACFLKTFKPNKLILKWPPLIVRSSQKLVGLNRYHSENPFS